jgi:hypothetical protein
MVSKKQEPLVVISNGRNGSKDTRRSKLLQVPTELYDDIVARSEGPLNQVLVELIDMAWSSLKRTGKQLAK